MKAYCAHFEEMLTGILWFNTVHIPKSKFVAKSALITIMVGVSAHRVNPQCPVCALCGICSVRDSSNQASWERLRAKEGRRLGLAGLGL